MNQLSSGSGDLVLSQASLEYLSDIRPEETWERRGYRGHSMGYRETQRWYTNKQSRLKNQVRDGSLPGDVDAFREEATDIFDRLKGDPGRAVRSLFPGRHFLFIVGMPRTGGTYLLQELLNVQGDQLKTYNDRMIHDGLPLRDHLTKWDRDHHGEKLLFEFSQMFAWMQREMSHLDWIPKKRISLAHALPLLDEWFGDKATYCFTVRHPGTVAQSWAETEGLNRRSPGKIQRDWARRLANDPMATVDDWDEVSFGERVLRVWRHYYRTIARALPLNGETQFLGFGSDLGDYVREFADKVNVDHQPGEITPVDRDLDEWWSGESQVTRIRETLSRLGTLSLRRPLAS